MEIDKTSTVVIFFLNGVNSLLGWSAVLAALDYFANCFKQYNVYSFLPVPLFVGYLTVGLTYHRTSNRFKYVTHIVVGNTIVTIALLFLLITSIAFEQTLTGFLLMLLFSYLIGIGANLSQITFYAMINYLSQNVVSKYTVGTAVSGLTITGIRGIILLIYGSTETSNTPIIIYFTIAIVVNTADMVMNILFCKSSVYKHKIDHFLLHHDKEKQFQVNFTFIRNKTQTNTNDLLNNLQFKNNKEDNNQGDYSQVTEQYILQQQRIQNQNYLKTLYQICAKIAPYPYIIMFNFAINLTIFPGPTFSKVIPGLDKTWSVVIYNLSYSFGDTFGKHSAGLNNAFNKQSILYIFFSRLYFFIPITIMAIGADSGDILIDNTIFPIINQFIFAFSSGLCVNAAFIMAFQVCPLAYKKYAGVLCGLCIQIGIMLGTVIEIPYAILMGIN